MSAKQNLMHHRTILLALALTFGVTVVLAARMFPGPPTDTDPRANTPNDPDFDKAEPDDPDCPSASGCDGCPSGCSVFDEQHRLFGFAPSQTRSSAIYRDPGNPSRVGQPQISGVSADLAWKLSIGEQTTGIAICDTGVRWEREELRRRIRLNTGELPVPCGPTAGQKGRPLAEYDCDGDGIFTPDDYGAPSVTDPMLRVQPNEGPHGDPTRLDGEDVIVHFSDGVDDDHNGFVDDIAGWDFFDDDNNPFDASSYSSAGNHGSGRASDALAEGNNGLSGIGLCPQCRLVPVRIWDTFVPDPNNFALCMLYAADNGIQVVEAAIGAVTTTEFAQTATQYAYEHGVALMEVSSDLNTADHNSPTNFNNTIFVKGTVADAEGASMDVNRPPFPQVALTSPVGTWFRDSNLTQYGGHAHIDMKGVTGSECTGQAAGAAGLLVSYATHQGTPLTSNEVKQILTITADDVLPGDTVGTGDPDPAQTGWDQHFGYGRVNLRAALERLGVPGLGIAAKIPPEATIDRPNWYDVLDPDRDSDGVNESLMVPIVGTASADRGATTSLSYTLEFGIGIEPTTFTTFASGSSPSRIGFDTSTSPPHRPGAVLGTLNLADVMAAFPPTTNFSAPPSGVVVQGQANVPSNQFAFTVRLRVTAGDDSSNAGEDRKVFFVHHDPTNHRGWPIAIDANGDGLTDGGGEPPPQMADLDGDNKMEIVFATAAGRIYAYHEDGTLVAGFPVSTNTKRNVTPHLGAPVFANGRIAPPSPTTTSRPAIADLDGDGYPEIVYANIEGDVYVFRHDGTPFPGFPVRIDPSLSSPAVRTNNNHLKTGIFGSPVLADLDGDGFLDIVVAAMDQRLYAWNRSGALLPGFPVRLQDANPGQSQTPVGAESINTPVVADLDGDGHPEIVIETNEVYKASGNSSQFFPNEQGNPTSIPGLNTGTVLAAAFAAAGGSGRIYAVHHDGMMHAGGPFVAGWPVQLDGLSINILPLIGPGHNVAVGDLDPGSPGLEVAASLTTSNLVLFRPDGTRIRDLDPSTHGAASDATQDKGSVLNLFEYPAIGDIDRDGKLDLSKVGITLNGIVDLVLVGQNMPFNHVLQAWTGATGQPLPGFPKVIDDFGLTTVPLIANVGATSDVGDTLNLPELVSGNGLYLVHAFDASGQEPAGWPKFTGGWMTGQPAAGDIDDDGLLEIAWATREGNFFIWDTPAPICNTATTANLDGRDGAYNPLVNTHNNNRYGEDTLPPARFMPGDIVTTSRDRVANTITLGLSRIPGDDMFCGTATRFDFRFSTAGPITTQAAFDAATAVASVPPPPPGSRTTGGSFTVGDPRFAEQLVFLGVQVLDGAGNRSPLTSVGSFDFTPLPPAFTIQRAALLRPPGPTNDRLTLQALVPLPITTFDPMTEAFSVAIADADGNFYTATVPAGSFVRNAARTRLAFHDLTGTRANGLTQVVLFADRRSGGMRFRLRGRKLDLSGADKALITTSLGFGPDAFLSTNTFRAFRAGFTFP